MGHYAPRWRHVEVVLNGEYVGVYLLTEKIKRDGDRVDIAKLLPTDTLGDDVTGGYILKVDWAQGTNLVNWVSDYAPPGAGDGQIIRILLDHPDEPHPAQAAYIEAYVDSFENALAGPDFSDTANGFRRFLDERSAIDYFLLSEFARNVDGYRQSTFFYKDKDSNGGKLKFGPVWDFDLGYGSANYCGATDPEGWDYLFTDLCSWTCSSTVLVGAAARRQRLYGQPALPLGKPAHQRARYRALGRMVRQHGQWARHRPTAELHHLAHPRLLRLAQSAARAGNVRGRDPGTEGLDARPLALAGRENIPAAPVGILHGR